MLITELRQAQVLAKTTVAMLVCSLFVACGNEPVQTRGLTHKKQGAEVQKPKAVPTSPVAPKDTVDTDPVEERSHLYDLRENDGSEIADIRDEAEALAVRLRMLDAAKQAVWIQAYVFRGDYTGYQIAKKLKQLKDRGVDVKVLVDSEMNYDLPTQGLYARMYEDGIDVEGFLPLFTGLFDSLQNAGNIRVYLTKENKRHHEKLFIIDPLDEVNKRAIIGGTNLSNDYFKVGVSKNGGFWRDRDVALRGPIVDDMADYFKKNYAYHENLNVTQFGKYKKLSTVVQKVLIKEPKFDAQDVARFNAHAALNPDLKWEKVAVRLLSQSPDYGTNEIYESYLRHIAEAKTEIDIANGYFIPDQTVVKALKDAASRGVKVRILTNSEETSDYPQVARAGRLTYEGVLNNPALNIELYEWGRPGVKGFDLYHSKFMCVDRARCLIGSFNLDPRSAKLNGEANIEFESETVTASLTDTFENDIKPATATRITLDMAKAFNNPTSTNDKVLNAIIKQLMTNL